MALRVKKSLSDQQRERPIGVSELAWRIQHLLEAEIGEVRVEGEVSNVRVPSSGHCYFVLKEGGAAINAVCFRSTLWRQRLQPANGVQLEVQGRVTAYTTRSEYQIIVESFQQAGLGELMRLFLELKEKLTAQGLFDAKRRRPIPRLPRRIGLVTSPTGAALRDMLNVLARRARGLNIYLSPAAVQGEQAPGEIVRAIERLQLHGRAEVLIVGRGGGSLEDLWAFNDERVVRAIAACPVPVISAVGHETDTTLADYAADLRAPTPSAAAELVSAHYGEVEEQVDGLKRRLARSMQFALNERRVRFQRCIHSWGLRKPHERIQSAMQRLDDLQAGLDRSIRYLLERKRQGLGEAAGRLPGVNPARRLELARGRLAQSQALLQVLGPARWNAKLASSRGHLDQLCKRLSLAMTGHRRRQGWRLRNLSERLEAVGPHAVLRRGYSIATHGRRDRIITRPDQVKANEVIRIRSAGGPWRVAVLPPGEDLFDLVD